MEFNIKIDDSQAVEFFKTSPRRANWAMREAMEMGGGHYRKELRKHIEKGGSGWPPLAWIPLGWKNKKPLQLLAQLVRFRVSKSKKWGYVLKIGLFYKRIRIGKKEKRLQTSAEYKSMKARFKSTHGLTLMQLARIHEYGKRIRVTPAIRKKFAAMGHPLKKSTKFIKIPKRPMVEWLWRRHKNQMPTYIERKFFKKFLSNEKPQLKVGE